MVVIRRVAVFCFDSVALCSRNLHVSAIRRVTMSEQSGNANTAGTSKADDSGDKSTREEYRDLKDKSVDSTTASTSSSSSSSSSSSPTHSPAASDDEDEGSKLRLSYIQKLLAQKLNLSQSSDDGGAEAILETADFDGLIRHWQTKGFKKIVTMVGAGISTSAGIPDFRSPNTGLYHNLQKYNLPHPTAVFEIRYFRRNPQPFFALAKELYPGKFKPTPCHYFIKLLHDKGLLLRHYTQNIDTLERIAGIPGDKLVEAHGTFHTNHCIECRREYSMEWVKEQIFEGSVPTCGRCNGTIKPDIVFFGEDLPQRFYALPDTDFDECDLLIVMGTSLEVQPFASLVGRPASSCVRLLINRDAVGRSSHFNFLCGSDSLRYGRAGNKRDVAWLGDCDEGVQKLADAIGFGDELRALVEREHARIDQPDGE